MQFTFASSFLKFTFNAESVNAIDKLAPGLNVVIKKLFIYIWYPLPKEYVTTFLLNVSHREVMYHLELIS